tara:strand:+ start:20018 stop:22030 length:2013 start_codon:yes stop_codon:yes gene_type:complete
MNKKLKETILALREEIHYYNYLYYIKDESPISDFEFDKKIKQLELLEKSHPEFNDPNSPTKRIGGGITKKFTSRNHNSPMYSLDNTYSKNEVKSWIKRIKKNIGNQIKLTYTCELKYDGASISLTYRNGKLIYGLTRGDGNKGDDVTENIRTIPTIPLSLQGDFPEDFEIRGEILMSKDTFKQLNVERANKGETLFKNPRNTTSGTLKMQDSSIVAKRKLMCFLYSVVSEIEIFQFQHDVLNKVSEWGFKVPNDFVLAKDLDSIFDFIDNWENKRFNLPYEIDGVVVKVNDLKIQNQLGYTSKSPRWAIAYKYKPDQALTKLKEITYQVGRTGAITPVANLDPISISGTMVKRASLYNADQIERLDLRIGDIVKVEKGGEIIPKIVGLDITRRNSKSKKIKFISNCPDCNYPLVKLKGESIHYCENSYYCNPQLIGKIQHFVSRKAMDIEGIGQETISLLFRRGLIKRISDLYSLNEKDILNLEGMAKKSVYNLLQGIEKSKKQPFKKVLFGLGIRFVGQTVAEKLTRSFNSIQNLSESPISKLLETNEIGDKIANSVYSYFSNEQNLAHIEKLKRAGLNLENSQNENKISEKFKNCRFVISGTFTSFSREEIQKLIIKNDGKVLTSISNKTTHLIAGYNMGPSKKIKAENLGIPLWSERKFIYELKKDN